ncbi:MAG: hypothetical protein JJD97_04765, partial [Gemmatimonadaceae bacterium]|nr:hypothetical protein [Gemmatimonadaceae bacterium]
LRIGASTTIATYLLPGYLARFRAAHPGVALRISTANTRDVARAVLERRVEIALVEGPVDDARLLVLPWRKDELVIVAPAANALARKQRAVLADLATAPFITRERGSGTRDVAEAVLASHGVSLRIALHLSNTEAIMQAVAAGLGLAIVSRAAIEDHVALGRVAVLSIRGLSFPRALSELRLSGRAPSPAAAAFRLELHEARGLARAPTARPRAAR